MINLSLDLNLFFSTPTILSIQDTIINGEPKAITIGKKIMENIDMKNIYTFCITAIAVIMIIKRLITKTKYTTWKKEKINLLGLYIREWGSDKDEIVQELWDENHRLEGEIIKLKDEIKIFKKEYDNLKLKSVFSMLLVLLAHNLKKKP